eukprot:2478511-Amphidinium_carterae.1
MKEKSGTRPCCIRFWRAVWIWNPAPPGWNGQTHEQQIGVRHARHTTLELLRHLGQLVRSLGLALPATPL